MGLGIGMLGVPLASQNDKSRAQVHGVVQDLKGEAVPGARIGLQGSELSALSGENGTYRIERIKPGRYWITVQAPGLDPQRRAVTLAGGEDRELAFALGQVPMRQSEIRAAEYDSLYRDFAARLKGSLDGVFLTRDDIDQSRQPQLGAVLGYWLVPLTPRTAVPYRNPSLGFTSRGCAPWESWIVQNSRNRLNPSEAERYPFISVNGERPFQGRALYEFDPQTIEAVEVYRGSAAYFTSAPTTTQCGVVIIWTK